MAIRGSVIARRIRGVAALLAAYAATTCTSTGDAAAPPATGAAGFEWTQTLHGPVSGESGDAMAIDADGAILVAGHHGGLDVDRDGTTEVRADVGDKLQAELTWSGAVSPTLVVYRNGERLATTSNDGTHMDILPPRDRGAHTYRVCESGMDICSNAATVEF